jgi:hypothetical protein
VVHVTSVASTGEVPVDPRNTPALTVTKLRSGRHQRRFETRCQRSQRHGGGPIIISAASVLLDGGAALDPPTGIFR